MAGVETSFRKHHPHLNVDRVIYDDSYGDSLLNDENQNCCTMDVHVSVKNQTFGGRGPFSIVNLVRYHIVPVDAEVNTARAVGLRLRQWVPENNQI